MGQRRVLRVIGMEHAILAGREDLHEWEKRSRPVGEDPGEEEESPVPGRIVILNGAPRSGKSSIAAAIQHTFGGCWMNLGVDRSREMTPARFQPGIGLRPG